MTQEQIFLDCPYSEKDEVKKLGAKFDGERKQWFIPSDYDIKPFAKWLISNNVVQEMFSLKDLLLSVQNTIAEQHNRRYWVHAEIIKISGVQHLYIDLISYDSSGQEDAKIRATIWNSRVKKIQNRFEEQTGMPFKAGFKVLLQVRVEYHPRYGLSLDILDIDPSFTLGEMEAKLNRIRARLKKEGIYNKNQDFAKITEFCKVAVIAPQQAAGLGDFKSQADILSHLKLCEFHYYFATFQGKKAVTDISAAFELVNQAHQSEQFDAVVLIRGGGAQADLFQLNEYDIAKAVCMAPLPVIIGIGHERDRTVLDEVANQICHTPSLVITHISGTIIQNAQNAKQAWLFIINSVDHLLNTATANNERLLMRIREQTVKLLSTHRQDLGFLRQTINHDSQRLIIEARHQIKLMMEKILLGDPKNILNQGYTIIRNKQSKVLTSKAMAEQEPVLIIEFKDGLVKMEKNDVCKKL